MLTKQFHRASSTLLLAALLLLLGSMFSDPYVVVLAQTPTTEVPPTTEIPSQAPPTPYPPPSTHVPTPAPSNFPPLPTDNPTPAPLPAHPNIMATMNDFLSNLGIHSVAFKGLAYATNAMDPTSPMLYATITNARQKMVVGYSFKEDKASFIAGRWGQSLCKAELYNFTHHFFYANISTDKFHSDQNATYENGTTLALSYPSGLDFIPTDDPQDSANQLLVADGMPGSRIFWLRYDPIKHPFEPGLPGSLTLEQQLKPSGFSQVYRMVGRGCNYTQHTMEDGVTMLPIDPRTPLTSPPPIGPPGHVKYRRSTGQIFFTQGHFIAVAELQNPADPDSPRVARIFFGRRHMRGVPGGPLNQYENIDRLTATTDGLGQMVISTDDTELIVAEGRLGLVRAINFNTGNVRIVAGNALEPVFPPRQNCSVFVQPCTAQSVVLTRPQGLALQVDPTTQRESLFITDDSMATLYRLFLSNNSIVHFSGEYPKYIWPNPNITKNNTNGTAYLVNVTNETSHGFRAAALPPSHPTYTGLDMGAIHELTASPQELFAASSKGIWRLGIIPEPAPPLTAQPNHPSKTGIAGTCTNQKDCTGHAEDVWGLPFAGCHCRCRPRYAGTLNCSTLGVTLSKTLTIPLDTTALPTTAVPNTSAPDTQQPTTEQPTTLAPTRTISRAVPQPTEPTVDPVAVEAATTTATVVVVSVGVIQTPTVATQASRGVLLLKIHHCVTELDEELDWMDSVLQLKIDSLGGYKYFGGAVIGNVLFVIVGCFLHFLACLGALQYLRRKFTPKRNAFGAETEPPTFKDACATLRFPSMFFFPAMFLYQSTMTFSVILARFTPADMPGAKVIGAFGITACFVLLVLLGVFFIFNFRAYFVRDVLEEEKAPTQHLNGIMNLATTKRMLMQRQTVLDHEDPLLEGGDQEMTERGGGASATANPSITSNKKNKDKKIETTQTGWRGKVEALYLKWTEGDGAWREPNELQCKRFGGLFKDYRADIYYFTMFEVASAFILGILDGIKEPGTMCKVILIAACLVYVAIFLLLLFLRPLLSRLALVVFTVVAGLQAVSAVLLVFASLTDSRTFIRYADNLALTALFVMGITTFIDLAIRVGYVSKNTIVWLCKKNEVDPNKEDSGDSNASMLFRSLLGDNLNTRRSATPLSVGSGAKPPVQEVNGTNFENFSFGGYLDPNNTGPTDANQTQTAAPEIAIDDDFDDLLRKQTPVNTPPQRPGKPPKAPQRTTLMQHEINRNELTDFMNQGFPHTGNLRTPSANGSFSAGPVPAPYSPATKTPMSNNSITTPEGRTALYAAAHASIPSSSSPSSGHTRKTSSSGNNSVLTSLLGAGTGSSEHVSSFAASPMGNRQPSSNGGWKNSTNSFGSFAMAQNGMQRRKPTRNFSSDDL